MWPGATDEDSNRKAVQDRKGIKSKVRVYDTFPIRNFDHWIEESKTHLWVVDVAGNRTAASLFGKSKAAAQPGFGGDALAAVWAPDGQSDRLCRRRGRYGLGESQRPVAAVAGAGGRRRAEALDARRLGLWRAGVSSRRARLCVSRPRAPGRSSTAAAPWLRGLAVVCGAGCRHDREQGLRSRRQQLVVRSGQRDDLPQRRGCRTRAHLRRSRRRRRDEAGRGRERGRLHRRSGGGARRIRQRCCQLGKRHSPAGDRPDRSVQRQSHVPDVVHDGGSQRRSTGSRCATSGSPAATAAASTTSSSLPPNFDEAKKYPLFVLIHGGHANMWRDSISLRWNYHLLAQPGLRRPPHRLPRLDRLRRGVRARHPGRSAQGAGRRHQRGRRRGHQALPVHRRHAPGRRPAPATAATSPTGSRPRPRATSASSATPAWSTLEIAVGHQRRHLSPRSDHGRPVLGAARRSGSSRARSPRRQASRRRCSCPSARTTSASREGNTLRCTVGPAADARARAPAGLAGREPLDPQGRRTAASSTARCARGWRSICCPTVPPTAASR